MFPPLLIQGLHPADLPAGCWRAIIHVPRTVLYTLTHLILEITVSGRKVEETKDGSHLVPNDTAGGARNRTQAGWCPRHDF